MMVVCKTKLNTINRVLTDTVINTQTPDILLISLCNIYNTSTRHRQQEDGEIRVTKSRS